ncbi:MAG: MotA/TolQ/ExbB proton channel family protein [Pseudomonadota bacterium]|nr:MotA/TolQ/ExbB proton channel family protein [Pseudomonadota bacterium]
MDIATILGIVSGIGLVLGAIMMGSGLSTFVDMPSVLVVIGGSTAALMIAFPLSTVVGSIKIALKAFFSPKLSPDEVIETVVDLAVKARKESIIALEKEEIEDPFLAKGIRLVVDGTAPNLVRSILRTEIGFMKQRHFSGQSVFKFLGAMGPAYGMIGTLIGLVQMLSNMEDPKSIGPAMAVALLTTLYGAMLATMICIPIADKLSLRMTEEARMQSLWMDAILAIQEGTNPRVVEQLLASYLPPDKRGKAAGEAEGA